MPFWQTFRAPVIPDPPPLHFVPFSILIFLFFIKIRGVYSDLIVKHDYFLTLLWRKVGIGSFWEQSKTLTFSLWLSHMIQFPFVERNIPKPILQEAFRAWAMSRRGYGSPWREDVKDVSNELAAMGVEHMRFVNVDAPYQLDIVCPHAPQAAIMVVSELARSTNGDKFDRRQDVVGSTRLQFHHLDEYFGVQCVPLCRTTWRSLGQAERRNYLSALLEQLPTELELVEDGEGGEGGQADGEKTPEADGGS